jgi:hypothetical protein
MSARKLTASELLHSLALGMLDVAGESVAPEDEEEHRVFRESVAGLKREPAKAPSVLDVEGEEVPS